MTDRISTDSQEELRRQRVRLSCVAEAVGMCEQDRLHWLRKRLAFVVDVITKYYEAKPQVSTAFQSLELLQVRRLVQVV